MRFLAGGIGLIALAFLVFSDSVSNQVGAQRGNPTDLELYSQAQKILLDNHVEQMNSTVPSPHLYPHQWSWDSAFIAFGYSHFDAHRAMVEMRSLFRGQWKNGLLPSIIFNPTAVESYFPGPAFWRTHTSPDAPKFSLTTGIVQPAVHAIAVLKVFQRAEDKIHATAFLTDMYPRLKAWHEYLYRTRDPHSEGLVYIRHMWESGMDDSPAWQDALESMDISKDDLPQYQRVDANKVQHSAERPTNFFYDRAVHLINIFYDNSYDEEAIFAETPFAIQDVLFNSILARAGEALAEIAQILNYSEDEKMHLATSSRTAEAISSKLYDSKDGFFYDYDLISKKSIPVKISGGFVSLYGAAISKQQMRQTVDLLLSDGFIGEDMSSWTIPSVSMDHPSYSNLSYWRGPVWLNINYLVRDGLLRNGKHDPRARSLASYLKERSLELLRTHGFYEYFSPIDGSPHGGHAFSWSAALAMDWMCERDDRWKNRGDYGFWPSTKVAGSILALFAALSMFGYWKSAFVVDGIHETRETR